MHISKCGRNENACCPPFVAATSRTFGCLGEWRKLLRSWRITRIWLWHEVIFKESFSCCNALCDEILHYDAQFSVDCNHDIVGFLFILVPSTNKMSCLGCFSEWFICWVTLLSCIPVIIPPFSLMMFFRCWVFCSFVECMWNANDLKMLSMTVVQTEDEAVTAYVWEVNGIAISWSIFCIFSVDNLNNVDMKKKIKKQCPCGL